MNDLTRLLAEREIYRQWMLFMQGMDAVFEANKLGVTPAECFRQCLTDDFVAYGKRATPKGIEAYTQMVMQGAATHFAHWKHVSSNELVQIEQEDKAILVAYVAAHHLHKSAAVDETNRYEFYTSTAKASFLKSEGIWKMNRLDRSKDDWAIAYGH
ncbi:MAG: hypothetical protein AAF587_18225 [Bacteroidota bacterium]